MKMTKEEKKKVKKSSKSPKATEATEIEQSSVEKEEESQADKRKETAVTSYDFEADWERIFIANIEHVKTVPYISLLKFRFMQIDFVQNELQQEMDRDSVTSKQTTANKRYLSRLTSRVISKMFGEDIIERRRKKIEEIFSLDDGPSICDYNAELGLEFWSRYCNIEKNTLKQSVLTNFWDSKGDSYRDFKEKLAKMNEKRGFLKCMSDSYKFLVQFLNGGYEPVRAPQKVISPEERFRVRSLANIKKASEEIIPPKEYKTIAQNAEKRILMLYKWIVDQLGGKWPRIRKPTLEEIYEDVLIWILDVKQSKQRIHAILNDRIKKEII